MSHEYLGSRSRTLCPMGCSGRLQNPDGDGAPRRIGRAIQTTADNTPRVRGNQNGKGGGRSHPPFRVGGGEIRGA